MSRKGHSLERYLQRHKCRSGKVKNRVRQGRATTKKNNAKNGEKKAGAAIMCWECNSHYHKDCADPFQNATLALTDCNMRQLEHIPKDQTAIVCRKIIQKVRDDYRFIRGCGFLSSEKEAVDCIKRAGTFNVLVQYCSCSTDGCNGAPGISRSWQVLATNLAVSTITTLVVGIVVK